MNLPRARRRRRLVSLTPLVDVVLILLIFYMLASSFLGLKELPLSTPAQQGELTSNYGALLVRVHPDGSVDLAGVAVPLPELIDKVRRRLRQRPDQSILLQPPDDTSVQTMVSVLDELQSVGAFNIVLGER